MSEGHENAGYRRLFETAGLTFGTGFPLTGARESRPAVDRELELAAHAESLGFDALWARDVPLYWPRFGDAGQTFDTWPWLSHVAKSAATLDRLSDGRLVMGVATGDRDPEYPAFDVDPEDRGELFREAVALLRQVWREDFPTVESSWGDLDGDLDLVPKPTTETVPLLPTGRARQSMEWLGDHGDGWLFYHLPMDTLESYLEDWRAVAGEKPYAMAVRTELAADPAADPEHVHQGFRAGTEWFREYVRDLDELGVDHVIVATSGEDPATELTRFSEQVIEKL